MAAVFREVTLGWGGEQYNITPTMAVLNRIEQDVSLSRLAHRLATGDPPLSQLATVISVMLREAGAKVTDEEVYQELMLGEASAVQDMAGAVMMAVFPQPLGKDAAPVESTKAAPSKATRKK